VNLSDETQAESLEPLEPVQSVPTNLQSSQLTPASPAARLPEPAADSSVPSFVDGQFRPLDVRNITAERTSSLILWAVFSLAILVGIGYLFFTTPRIDAFFWIACIVGATLIVATSLFSLLWPKIEHKRVSFKIDPLGIEIHQGVFWRSQICVPIGRVQHADVGQGPLQRINERTTMPFDHEDNFDLSPATPDNLPRANLEQSFTGQNNETAPVSAEQPPVELPLKYLHATSLAFDLIAHVRSYLFPLVFGLVGAAKGDIGLLIVSGILFIPAVLSSAFRYFTLRYRIEDAHFYVDQGLIFRTTRTIPVDRIQNIDLTQNVLHRIFKVAEVKVETASGTEAEAVLRVLSMEEVDTLRTAIFAGKQLLATNQTQKLSAESRADNSDFAESLSPVGQASNIARVSDPADVEEVWKIPFVDLVKAGLASNRGLVMLGIGLVTFDQFYEKGYETVFAFLSGYLPKDTGSLGFSLITNSSSVVTTCV